MSASRLAPDQVGTVLFPLRLRSLVPECTRKLSAVWDNTLTGCIIRPSMKLARLYQLAGALSTFWVTLILAEVPGVHACAVHSTAAAHGAAHSHSSGKQGPHKGQCTCPESACCTPLAAIPVALSPASARWQLITDVIASIPEDENLPIALDFRTVFANGPPSSLIAPEITPA